MSHVSHTCAMCLFYFYKSLSKTLAAFWSSSLTP
nr:hypothetical protein JOCKYQNQ_JOCKYQNQ_CDS_0011 [Autographiviridae sp.]